MDLSGIIAKRERKEQTRRMLRVLGHATVAYLVVAAIVAGYLGIIPLRCQAGVNPQLLRSNRMYWRWYEVAYIYLRDWSLTFVIFVAPAIIIRYFIS